MPPAARWHATLLTAGLAAPFAGVAGAALGWWPALAIVAWLLLGALLVGLAVALRSRAPAPSPAADARRALPVTHPAHPVRRKQDVKDAIGKRGRLVTLRGEVVQSKPELRIANWLFKQGIAYEYEPVMEGAMPDFWLPQWNVIIEHWGMDHSKYRYHRAKKTRMYHSRGYILVETEKKDVPRLELVLEARLRKAAPGLFRD